ncbi:MAG: cobalamin-independent methionine synthase II family protein [Pseudomonadota bacterium]|nr:cobalamin-independent methionine synthase II family protein [Pseudomonadota bacterium]
MKISTDRILTTHVGSLPRPSNLCELLIAEERNEPHDTAALQMRTNEAVRDAVAKQVSCGIDSVSDGDMSKVSYTFYVRHRLSNIDPAQPPGAEPPREGANQDILDHPDFAERVARERSGWALSFGRPWVVGPVEYENHDPLKRDIANLKEAIAENSPEEAFMTAASPGVLSKFVPDDFYKNEDSYIEAMASAMQTEYEAIHAADLILQIDCPDFGSARHNQYKHLSDQDFLKIAWRNMEAVNAATANIPPEKMRLHICWGNYEGPHTHDFPLAKIFPVLMASRPAAILFEGANPRHEHEWEDLQDIKIPDHKILIPGVIDSTSNFVEHPKLIAQRLCNWAKIVDKERVIASADCGFGTFAREDQPVAESIVWSKFRAMAEGASIATDRLW